MTEVSSERLATDGNGRVAPLETIEQVRIRARERLRPELWAYCQVGAGEEVTLRRNREAFRSVAIVPRVLRDVSAIDQSTRLLGQDLAMPIICAPVGSLVLFDEGGAQAVASAAAAVGTVACVGIRSSPGFDKVQQSTGGRNWLQIDASSDELAMERILDRIDTWQPGAVCIAVDSPVLARRDQLLQLDYDWRSLADMDAPNFEGIEWTRFGQSSATWSSIEKLRSRTELPLAIKGILHPDDARRAVEIGAEAVYVSNHGGRQLDHAPSTLEVLPSIVDAVDGKAQVILDSGCRHGSDAFVALALGADAVAVGRLVCWGLAAQGQGGVECVLQILSAELESTMALAGTVSLEGITREMIDDRGLLGS